MAQNQSVSTRVHNAVVQIASTLFTLVKVVLWIVLFLFVAITEVIRRILERLEVLQYMEWDGEMPEVNDSCIVVHGKPNRSVVALRTKYIHFDLKIPPRKDA